MKGFDDLWRFVSDNNKVLAQNYHELHHVYDLMKGCDSYLEIGSSEGNSLYVLGHAVKEKGHITYLDMIEEHTKKWREPKEMILVSNGYTIRQIKGDSHDPVNINKAKERRYDCVLIDAGHSYEDVIQDARNFAPLADKYAFFHDVTIPETNAAFMDYVNETKAFWYKIIYDTRYGYGVIKK